MQLKSIAKGHNLHFLQLPWNTALTVYKKRDYSTGPGKWVKNIDFAVFYIGLPECLSGK
jgi:hypothetical protein